MSNPATQNDAAVRAIAELAAKAAGTEIASLSEVFDDRQQVPVAFIGGKPINLEEFLGNPCFKRGARTLIDRDSFVEHVNDQKQKGTTIYASLSGAKMTAVFDDHEPGEEGKAGWQKHQVILDLQSDPDWQEWLNLAKPSDQDDFAQALQDLAHTIEEPDAAAVRDIVLKFQATQVRSFERPVYNEQNGSVTIGYKDETEQVGSMRLPEKLYLAVSPYRSVAPVTTEAFLRFRFSSGKVLFMVKIVRPDKVEEESFRQMVRHIEEKTGLFVRICA